MFIYNRYGKRSRKIELNNYVQVSKGNINEQRYF